MMISDGINKAIDLELWWREMKVRWKGNILEEGPECAKIQVALEKALGIMQKFWHHQEGRDL